jgi:O-acetylserine/cysteine efflux transporter
VSARDAGLGLLVAALWGLAFVATKVALETFSPPELVLLRFVVAGAAAAFLPRPRLPWGRLVALGLFLYTGQFVFQFFGIAAGMPAGLAAVAVQTQALFTVALAALVLGERPGPLQLGGIALATVGLGVLALTVGVDFTARGLALTLLSALSWAVGNLLLKRAPATDMAGLAAWLSLVPPLPALALMLALDGPAALPRALATAPWVALAAAVYLGAAATVVAYAIWGALLRRHPTAAVAPFALLVPVIGMAASAAFLGERFGTLRLAGIGLVLAGVGLIALAPSARDAPA